MPWILAIVRHRLVDGARRHARTSGREVHIDDADVTFLEPATNPDQDASDDVEALQRAVRVLPDSQREAIELLKLQEMSLKQAAAVSGSSVGALKVATHRAMVALRKALSSKRR